MLPEELSRGENKVLALQAEKNSMQSCKAGGGIAGHRFGGQ